MSADLENEKIKYRDLNIQLESDKNESDLALSGIFRARVGYRDNQEEALSTIQNLTSEIEGLTQKVSDSEKEIDLKLEELTKLEKSSDLS